MNRSIIITGCDSAHYALASELLASIRDRCGGSVTVGFINVGDTTPPFEVLSAADHVVNVPDDEFHRGARRGFRLAYLQVKPRMPEFFPGYETYIWLDGDTWVQNPAGLQQLVHCAGLADVCVHPERDVNYLGPDNPRLYLHHVYSALYGTEEADRYSPFPSYNTGVFAARESSPLWRMWTAALAEVRRRLGERSDVHFSDQIPMHRLIVSGMVSVCPLRAVNNWQVLLAPPAVNLERKLLLAPSYPFEEINILHLVGAAKSNRYELGDGGQAITFRYGDIKALFAR